MTEQNSSNEERINPSKRQTSMRSAEFAVFTNDVFETVLGTRGDVAPLDVLRKYGLDVDLPPNLEAKVMPLLKATRDSSRVSSMRGGGACGACGACGLCAACGALNAASVGAAAAAVWAFLSIGD
jgi:hypothetical protein